MQKNQFNCLPKDSPTWLSNFVNIYQTLATNNLDLLAKIYHKDITFIDPLHQVDGFDDLYQYFNVLYQNLLTCEFVINHVIVDGNEAAVYWTMTYKHSKLNKGELVTVSGSSHIKGCEDKVVFHRDYLDLGAMLYEQIPLFGKVTKWIKAKAAS
ncbi:MAG: nuclear transport factor 2 family protein [Colwelliaceae bacterium]|nr:nuclear transport factor 2 family protein [Colwelliaceae bacterium]